MARKKRVWLGGAISLACLYLVFRALDPATLGAALAQANLFYVLPAVAVYFVGVWLRSLRWRLLLGPVLPPERRAKVSTAYLFRIMVIGFTVNNVLPARLGELARAWLLWRGERVEPGATVATIVLERVLDGLTLLLFAGVAALLVEFPPELQRAAWITAALFLLVTVGLVGFLLLPAPFVALAMRVLRLLPERFAHLGERLVLTFAEGLGVLRQGRALVGVLTLSVLAWAVEATMYLIVMLGFPFGALPEAALLGAAAANFGAMIPSSPGYVGTFHLPLQIVLTQVFAVPLAQATSYTLVLHATLVVPVVLLGLAFLARDWRRGERGEGTGQLFAALRDMRVTTRGNGSAGAHRKPSEPYARRGSNGASASKPPVGSRSGRDER